MDNAIALGDADFDPGALYFVPLGGSGEIGMNLNLYGHAGRWLMVDLGISFGDETTPGVEILLPDPAFIAERREDLAGLVITHAHEDHLGAVPYLWPELRCPVYCTPFAASVLRVKLQERGLSGDVQIIEVPLSGRFQVGPFDLELVTVTHSIPEPNALVIRTPAGTVLHSGDWKLDPDPVIGTTADEAALKRLGREGVTALVCDSTNALVPGVAGAEAAVRDSLITLFGRYTGRIAVGCFATNVARLHSIAVAAQANDRHVALVGRSLWRIDAAARANGYLTDLPPFVTEHDAGFLPRDKCVLICTGSQGEPRAALSRIAGGDHPEIDLVPGDVVVFSAREIPGNEKDIAKVQNALIRRGIEVVTADDAFVHVSGHPARDELTSLYQWVRPRAVIPVHGERRHLTANAQLAQQCQVGETVIPEDGAVIRIGPGPAEIVGHVPSGRLCLDGRRIVPVHGGAMRSRHRMMNNGAAVATVLLTAKGDLATDPRVSVMGLLDPEETEAAVADLVDLLRRTVETMPMPSRRDDEAVREAVRLAIRRSFNASQGRKPLTEVHVVRL
ncbi:ribonuclease J [Rhodospirillum centenum]|uniref:Metallo-beta-lactamase, putative n=1 Tax=Rhodospirillum centenum (strain ATCC 51521 / SW) TaxID=414684 RepID=B6ISW5_RHOCS|nr:ribonuclease J [Rhodospirillum centenum]ACI98636.1 metallo-beta-lactamase, putative [Rhodospirillum centenum SW]